MSTQPANVHNTDDGMQIMELIGELASTVPDEGAAKTDDVLLVDEDGTVYIPTEVVYDSANDAVVIKIALTEV